MYFGIKRFLMRFSSKEEYRLQTREVLRMERPFIQRLQGITAKLPTPKKRKFLDWSNTLAQESGAAIIGFRRPFLSGFLVARGGLPVGINLVADSEPLTYDSGNRGKKRGQAKEIDVRVGFGVGA